MDENLARLSRTISHALRHKPEEYGLVLDHEGWVDVRDLLTALQKRRSAWRQVGEAELGALMTAAEKQRFELRDGRIRAFYGHSVAERIERVAAIPPELLYHGTTPQAAATIRVEGLKPMQRQYVHLAADEPTARVVALRRTDQPVILHIAALRAHQQGFTFYLGNENVWLVDALPPEFMLK